MGPISLFKAARQYFPVPAGQLGLSNPALAQLATPSTHVLEASVQDLQLSACELGLFLELFQTLGPVTHRGQFKLILHAVCGEW